jgi:hypothetical protein
MRNMRNRFEYDSIVRSVHAFAVLRHERMQIRIGLPPINPRKE